MNTAKNWRVQIFIDEHPDGSTRAEARLDTHTGTSIHGVGTARCNPRDLNVPEVGDELATARALLALADRLLDVTTEDIAALTHEPVQLSSDSPDVEAASEA